MLLPQEERLVYAFWFGITMVSPIGKVRLLCWKFIIESDSLLTVRSLNGGPDDFLELGAPACGFLAQIDRC